MRRLLVLRHAKAGPHDEKRDKERELMDRGRSDSALIGRTMRERGYLPEIVLCSSAARTRETWEHAARELHAKPETKFFDALYDASSGTILSHVQRTSDTAASVLYIGHNPGLEQLARSLVREPEDNDERGRLTILMSKYPTAALAVIDFPVDHWVEVALRQGILIDFVMPADLKSK